MKRIFSFSLMLIAFFTTTAQNNKLKRNVLLKLEESETVHYNEFFVSQSVNQNKYACYTYDGEKQNYKFVFNGKAIMELNENKDSIYNFIEVLSINVAEANGYIFCYPQKEGKDVVYYVNYKGSIKGPFSSLSALHPHSSDPRDQVYEFYTYDDQKWYGHKNNQSTLLISPNDIDDNPNLISSEWTDNGSFVTINGNKISEKLYRNLSGLVINKKGTYAFVYEENEKYFINIKGKVSEGFKNVNYTICLTDTDKYAYAFYKNNNWYLNQNGVISAPFDWIGELRYNDKKGLYYRYSANGDGKVYEFNNGKKTLTNKLITNTHEYQAAAHFRTVNYTLNLRSADKTHKFESSIDYEHILIDGKKYGKAPALHAWYDAVKNAFIWNTVEGKELVVYEYKL